MTRNEKKATHSEISNGAQCNACKTTLATSIELRYVLLQGSNSMSFASPVDGYVHLILVDNGLSGTYSINGQSYIIRSNENSIHPISYETSVQWKGVSEETKVLLTFTPRHAIQGLLQHFGYDEEHLKHGLISKSSQQLSSTVKRLNDVYNDQDPLRNLRLQILTSEVILYQLRIYYRNEQNEPAEQEKSYLELVQTVKKLIDEDFSRNYTISELAKKVGTNEQYIKKYFKKFYGKTVMVYTTSVKMEYAKRLIMTGEYRVSDVAQMVGYKHATHFTAAFKKYFGFIPNSLRYSIIGGMLLIGNTLASNLLPLI